MNHQQPVFEVEKGSGMPRLLQCKIFRKFNEMNGRQFPQFSHYSIEAKDRKAGPKVSSDGDEKIDDLVDPSLMSHV